LLADDHAPNIPGGQSWLRLHLHLLNASGPLAIIVVAHEEMQYAVFANGQRVGETKGFRTASQHFDPPFRILLPQSSDVVLAIHFVGPVIHYGPLKHVEIGQGEAVGDRTDLTRYRNFEELWLVFVAITAIFLACVPFAFALLLAQPDHAEYLWLAIFCFIEGTSELATLAIYSGWAPGPTWALNASQFYGVLVVCSSLEFAAALADLNRRTWLRVIQGANLIPPVLWMLKAYSGMAISYGVLDAVWFIAMAYLLLTAYSRGRKESGLLFFPLLLLPSSGLMGVAQSVFPKWFGPFWVGHFRGVGFSADQLGSLVFVVGLVIAVLYRFVQVSKDEQLAASELEAARSVQQLLIPATQPATPGFTVESVYLPAKQVGGDFFLVLPAPENSTDQSLLAIMGDVSGKGLHAAMVVSAIIGGLRMQLSRQPSEVLAHLNRLLTGHISGFATCCVVLLHVDGRMQIANAGNPAPYCDGQEIPTLPNLPLGVVADAVYEESCYTLGYGRQLTFVSDGVVEATSHVNNELFGFDRTQAISIQSASAIAEAARLFGTDALQADDITVLTISLQANDPIMQR
jgi:Stage II sporulation protein E (SpoIIE)